MIFTTEFSQVESQHTDPLGFSALHVFGLDRLSDGERRGKKHHHLPWNTWRCCGRSWFLDVFGMFNQVVLDVYQNWSWMMLLQWTASKISAERPGSLQSACRPWWIMMKPLFSSNWGGWSTIFEHQICDLRWSGIPLSSFIYFRMS